MKNLVLATDDKRILYLSQTYEGSSSEKRMADEADFCFDFVDAKQGALVEMLLELGFPGYQARGAAMLRPPKKPRGGELTPEQKKANQARARERVVAQGTPFRGCRSGAWGRTSFDHGFMGCATA